MADGGLGQQIVRRAPALRWPWWWQDGVKVIGSDRAGTIGSLATGEQVIHLDGDEGDASYVYNPDPSLWKPVGGASVTQQQIDRVVYDADAALCRAFGCGGINDYMGQPESQRVNNPDLRPMPVGRPDLLAIRERVRTLVRVACEEFRGK